MDIKSGTTEMEKMNIVGNTNKQITTPNSIKTINNMKAKEYNIISDNNMPSFNKQVNAKLKLGWELYGAPTASANLVFQAMVLTNSSPH
jgi:hypothetical protein